MPLLSVPNTSRTGSGARGDRVHLAKSGKQASLKVETSAEIASAGTAWLLAPEAEEAGFRVYFRGPAILDDAGKVVSVGDRLWAVTAGTVKAPPAVEAVMAMPVESMAKSGASSKDGERWTSSLWAALIGEKRLRELAGDKAAIAAEYNAMMFSWRKKVGLVGKQASLPAKVELLVPTPESAPEAKAKSKAKGGK